MALPNTFEDNTSSPHPAQDVGLKITKPGVDADAAADNDLIFSSSWAALPVAFETELSTTYSFGSIDNDMSAQHGLSITPFTQAWYSIDGGDTYRWSPFVAASSTGVYITGNPAGILPNDTGTIIFKVKAYNIDLTKDVDYAYTTNTGLPKQYDPDYGIKIVKEGKDIDSTDMRDFILHSRCQSPLILAIKTQDTKVPQENSGGESINIVQYTTKYDYRAWVFGGIKVGETIAANTGTPVGTLFGAPLFSQSYPRLFTNGFTSYLAYFSPDRGATLIVFRDPMFAAVSEEGFY